MDEFNKYHREKFVKEHPEKFIKVNGPMPENLKRVIVSKQKWAQEVKSRKKVDLAKLKQKVIV